MSPERIAVSVTEWVGIVAAMLVERSSR